MPSFSTQKNLESRGVAFPKKQAMRVYGMGCRGVGDERRAGPFAASLRNFKSSACVWKATQSSNNEQPWLSQEQDSARLKCVQQNYMVYNYCADINRFPHALPPECTLNTTT